MQNMKRNFDFTKDVRLDVLMYRMGAPRWQNIVNPDAQLVDCSKITWRELYNLLSYISVDKDAMETFWSIQFPLRSLLITYYYKVPPSTIILFLNAVRSSGLDFTHIIDYKLHHSDSFEKYLSKNLKIAPEFSTRFVEQADKSAMNADFRDYQLKTYSHSKDCHNLFITALYLMRVKHSEDTLIEIFKKFEENNVKIQSARLVSLAENWKEYRELPLDWALEVASA